MCVLYSVYRILDANIHYQPCTADLLSYLRPIFANRESMHTMQPNASEQQ